MADKKKSEPKAILEREYIVPLRREWLKVAKHKRANRAVKELKAFLARHMKVYDRDLNKIKLDIYLNNELRFRGMRKPLAKVKVKAKKFEDGIVKVELATLPEFLKFKKQREERQSKEVKAEKKVETKKEEKVELDKEVEKEDKEKQEEAKEKEEASKEESLQIAKEQAKEQKHVSKEKISDLKNFPSRKAQRGR